MLLQPVPQPAPADRPRGSEAAPTLGWEFSRRTAGGDGALQLEVPVLGARLPGSAGQRLAREINERYRDLKIGASVIALTSTRPLQQRLIIIASPGGGARRPVEPGLLRTLVDESLAGLSAIPGADRIG